MTLLVDIRKNYPGFSLDVQFETKSGVLALLGASGCGKSMTLQCIAGIRKPDEGYISLNGQVLFDSKRHINLPPQKRRAGLLFQNYALFPNMTVAQNIAAGMRRDKQIQNRPQRLKELLAAFYLTDQRNHYPAQLSGGQQQRAALARVFASEPRMIMLDEPLSALDSYLRWQLEQELVRTLAQYDGTVLYVSHNRDEVYRLCDTVCIIDHGVSECVVEVGELFRAPRTFSAALLSGCKNFSRAEKTGKKTAYAADWQYEVTAVRDVPDGIRYIGVRAHSLSPAAVPEIAIQENTLPCVVERVTDDVFGTIVTLRPVNAQANTDFSYLRMEISKPAAKDLRAGETIPVGFFGDEVLLLT